MDIPVEKNKTYKVEIIDNGINGEGIAKIDGFTIFVPKTIKGEICDVLIVKVLSSHAFGKLVNLIKISEFRKEPDCISYKRCGGCELRHMTYEKTLEIKKNNIQNLINKTLSKKVEVKEVLGMENPFYYRNKAIFPVDKDGNIGVFANRSHDVIKIEECKIQTKISQEIAKKIARMYEKNIYNEETGKGLLRHIMIREAFATKEIMCIAVQNGEDEVINVKELIKEFPQIKTIVININTKNTNVILSNKNKIIYGDGTITDVLGGFKFKISPNSFYQVNPIQTEKIYKLTIEQSYLKSTDILCDLYCGIGTIGIFASKYVQKVYGIEIVPEAIENAIENKNLNNIESVEFIQGDVETAFDKLLKNGIKPNVVIVDPPRKGLDENTINNLLELKPERISYVSCNPATLVRDLAKLEEVYDIKMIIAIDNFCYTSHIESVAFLEFKV